MIKEELLKVADTLVIDGEDVKLRLRFEDARFDDDELYAVAYYDNAMWNNFNPIKTYLLDNNYNKINVELCILDVTIELKDGKIRIGEPCCTLWFENKQDYDLDYLFNIEDVWVEKDGEKTDIQVLTI